ncbi:hypothetical protein PCAR4_250017 [Paraburkholderia caribensis]|nr:hypothetical protein PCAR4_250017 [Paraburkholderia caribensis]
MQAGCDTVRYTARPGDSALHIGSSLTSRFKPHGPIEAMTDTAVTPILRLGDRATGQIFVVI